MKDAIYHIKAFISLAHFIGGIAAAVHGNLVAVVWCLGILAIDRLTPGDEL